jgi:hypothetical protein
MRSSLLVSLVLASSLAACEGSVPKGPDAANFCKGSAYDPCNDEHSCPLVTIPVCQPVGSAMLVVCTEACTPGGSACPVDKTGVPGTCVATSGSNYLCVPAAKATCTPIPDNGGSGD